MRARARRGVIRRSAAAALVLSTAGLLRAQKVAARDSARCDSVLAAARADSVTVGIFISVVRADQGELPKERAGVIASTVGGLFAPPRPFRLSVFSGTARMRLLRAVASDTASDLRAPTLTGSYRFTVTKRDSITAFAVVRPSLMIGFDSAARRAIREAALIKGSLAPPDGEDSMRLEVRFSTDSVGAARRMISAYFPRLPVIDAVPRRGNPPAAFPAAEKDDSVTSGDVVLRFVVDRDGAPVLETVEIVRASSLAFLKSAIASLMEQQFVPATVHGCAVAQVIDYPFAFALPEPSPKPPRH